MCLSSSMQISTKFEAGGRDFMRETCPPPSGPPFTLESCTGEPLRLFSFLSFLLFFRSLLCDLCFFTPLFRAFRSPPSFCRFFFELLLRLLPPLPLLLSLSLLSLPLLHRWF